MVRDVNAPRRPLTGYMRYIKTIRQEVEEETGLNGIKVTPHLSARWNALDDEEKDVHNKEFAKEMKKHQKLMSAYKKTDSYKAFQQAKKAKKFGKKPKDKNAPKRASTAFFIFANEIRDEVRSENPDASIGEVGKILGEQWGSLSDSEKATYQAKSEKARAAYQKKLAKYQKTKHYAEYQETLATWKKAKKNALKEAKKAGKSVKKIVKRKK